jgi:hypothetical protein
LFKQYLNIGILLYFYARFVFKFCTIRFREYTRERNVFISEGMFEKLDMHGVVWSNGVKEPFDVIIWCTGFGYGTSYLSDLVKLDDRGKASTMESKSTEMEGLWFVGYGNWTGYASATLIGINRNVKQTIQEVQSFLEANN